MLVTFDDLRVVVDPFRRNSPLPHGGGLSLADVIPPHMTVASPACPDPRGDAAGDRLRHCLAGLGQFRIRFSEVRTFPHGTVYIAPEPSAELERLLARVAAGFAEFGGVRADHVWHLSVSRQGGEPVAAQFRSSFRPVSVPVTRVSIWTQEAPGSRWSLCHDVRLAEPGKQAAAR